MACSFNLKSTFLPDASAGGQWEVVGFSLSESGPFTIGGNWPWQSNVNEDPLVVFDNIQQGYYKLNYFLSGECGGSQEIVIPVIGGGDAGVTKSMTICTSSGLINIASELMAEFDGGVLEPTFEFTGSGITSGGYIANNVNTPIDDQFDPLAAGVGTYQISLTISPQTPSGYSLASCCTPSTASLIITVEESDLQISIDDSCRIQLVSDTGCESATFELWKDTGSGYVATGITTLPYQTQENADWKLVATGCDCGSVDSNIVNSTGCCLNQTLTMYFDSDFCAFFLIGGGGCSGGTYKWYRSCDNEQTWQHQPQHDGSDFIFVNDDCCWQIIKEGCSNGCQDYSNIDCASGCAGGCNGALAASFGPCTYTIAQGSTYCTGGTLKLIKQGTGVVDSVALTGSNTYPITFNIPSNGTYYASLSCNDGCPDYTGPTQTYSNCGSNPTCNTTVNATVNSCVITVTATNCPSPIYTFINPSGVTVYSGPNNSLAVAENGVWQIRVNGCPDCPELSTTVNVTGCETTSCNCVATLGESPCADFTLSLNDCGGYSIFWQYRANASASWQTVQNGGITYQGTTNGQYRVLLTKSGCTDETTAISTITCFGTSCNCVQNLSLNSTNCVLTWTSNNCTGYSIVLQRLLNGTWVDYVFNPSIPYTVPANENGQYRLKATKSGCQTVYSNAIQVDCSTPGCQLVIDDMYIDPNDCNRVIVEYSGAGGSGVTIQWTKATSNPLDCNTAGGWAAVAGSSGGSSSSNGTGSFYLDLDSTDCNRCIRAIVNANANGCGVDVERVFAPCCCVETPTIDDLPVNELHRLYLTKSDGSNSKQKTLITGSGPYNWRWQMRRRVEIDGVTTEDSLITSSDFWIEFGSRHKKEPMFALESFEVSDQNGVITLMNIHPDQTTHLNGPVGVVNQSDLYVQNVTDTVFVNAVELIIKNAMKTQLNADEGIHYKLNIDIGNDAFDITKRSYMISFRAKRDDANWFDLYSVRRDNLTGADTYVRTLIWQWDDPVIAVQGNYSSPCGFVTTKTTHATGFYVWSSGNEARYMSLTGSSNPTNTVGVLPRVSNSSHDSPKSITCVVNQLTVDGECAGASYLWSTGETTESITVPSGTYSVVVTCPDGCEYTISITV